MFEPLFKFIHGFMCYWMEEVPGVGWQFLVSDEKFKGGWHMIAMPYYEPPKDKEGNILHQPMIGEIHSGGHVGFTKKTWIPRFNRETFPASKAWIRAYPNQTEHIRYNRGEGGFRMETEVKVELKYIWDGTRYVPSWIFNLNQKESLEKKFHSEMEKVLGYPHHMLKVLKKFTIQTVRPNITHAKKESVQLPVAKEARISGGYAKSGRPMLSKVAKNLDKLTPAERQVFWHMMKVLEDKKDLASLVP